MRKVILNLAVSLDGFIEDANGAYDWCFTDQDYGMSEFFSNTDTIFIGRKSFELITGMEDEYFPAIQKIYVFSDTLQVTLHPKVEVLNRDNWETKVRELINTDGPDIWLFGGAGLVSSFLQKRLLTELLLSVHPVILGGGKPLFKDLKERVNLLLTDTQTYDSGLVQLRYVLKPVFDYSILKTDYTHSGEESD
ncbi:dihydrofolate reductase [Mucilaginibacter sp. Bleaf8]|uniref:dihydrofolate reductase family protein n=1 Tax=Mucilaginibacter sp. Bleaf8 TaxID=2834430 RepID=UPI001BCDE610|nr:dihydrofolate reductase family protein [Mucilaginibacter sp. Bleaf8]MBS7565924.1 dihydrofolate reductase [Mucilaginibacter sp. Bleaf8]